MLQKLSPIFFFTRLDVWLARVKVVLALLDCSFRFRLGTDEFRPDILLTCNCVKVSFCSDKVDNRLKLVTLVCAFTAS